MRPEYPNPVQPSLPERQRSHTPSTTKTVMSTLRAMTAESNGRIQLGRFPTLPETEPMQFGLVTGEIRLATDAIETRPGSPSSQY